MAYLAIKHGQEKRRLWRKLYLAVYTEIDEVICADLSLSNITNTEAFPVLIHQTYRKIKVASADGAYDRRVCHDKLRSKKIMALIPLRSGASYWSADYAVLNQAVVNQRLSGDNTRRKIITGYHRSSIAETAIYRLKQLFSGYLVRSDCKWAKYQ
ncbi:MAG: transposase [Serratia symbiotica]|nr:transposase [Serratia symbiotica]